MFPNPLLKKDFYITGGIYLIIRKGSRVMVMVMIVSLLLTSISNGQFGMIVQTNAAAESKVLYEENFDSNTTGEIPEGWTKAGSGTLQVENGRLVGESKDATGLRVVFGESTWKNYTFEADVTFETVVNDARWISLMYRASDLGSAPYFQFAMRKNGGVEVAYNDGGWKVRHSDTVTPNEFGESHRMKVEVFGNNVRQYLDDVMLFDVDSINELEQGKVGFQIDRSKATFDNIIVSELRAESLEFQAAPATAEQFTEIPLQINANLPGGKTINVTKQAVITLSDEAAAQIVDGNLILMQPGELTVTAAFEGESIDFIIQITESTAPPTVTALTPNTTAAGLVLGENEQFKVSGMFSNYTEEDVTEAAIWSSADENIATVSEGVVTPLAVGETKITAEIDNAVTEIRVKVWEDPADKNLWLKEDFSETANGQLPSGWNVIEGSFEVENGKLKGVSASQANSSRITLPFDLDDVGDYIFEADVSFLSAVNDARWASLMYRIQPATGSYPYYQFAFRQGASAANGLELAYRTPGNAWDVRETTYYKSALELNKSYHFKIVASQERVQHFVDGVKMIDTDLAYDLDNGTLGFQVNGASVLIDNVRVTLNPGKLPSIPSLGSFQPKQPETGLVLPPTVIAEGGNLSEKLSEWEQQGVTSVILEAGGSAGEITASMDGKVIGSLQQTLEQIHQIFIPLIQVEDAALAIPVADLLNIYNINDVHIVSTNPSIVKQIRERFAKARGAVEFTASEYDAAELEEIANTVHESDALVVVLSKQAATAKVVEYFQSRSISVWVKGAVDLKSSHEIIHNGVNGIISTEPIITIEAMGHYPENTLSHTPSIIGHRGSPGTAPENTLLGFKNAIENGVSNIELDIMETKDGKLVIMHDFTVDRTTNGTGQIIDMTLEEIRELSIKGASGEKVPTFKEVLELAKGTGVTIMTEIKAPNIEEKVVQEIEEAGMVSESIIVAFSDQMIRKTRVLNPKLPSLYLTSTSPPVSKHYDHAYKTLDFNNSLNALAGFNFNNVYPELREYAGTRGLLFWVWTVNDLPNVVKYIKMGVNGINTDISHLLTPAPIRLEAVNEALSMEVGKEVSIEANQIFRAGEDKTITPELVIIDNNNVIKVEGNQVTGLKAGKALVMARTEIKFADESWNHFSAPIEITVTAKPGTTDPGTTNPGTPDSGTPDPDVDTPTLPESISLMSSKMQNEVAEIVKRNEALNNVQLQLLADGFTYTPAAGEERVTFKLPVKAPINAAPVAVYKVGDDGSLSYVGGKLTGNLIEIELSEAGNYVVLAYDKKFEDLSSKHWSYEAVRQLSAMQVINGKTLSKFVPDSNVTRAEFVAMLVRVLGLQASGQASFTDVEAGSWYADALAAAEESGLALGLGNGKFGPNQTISREEMATFLVRAFEQSAEKTVDRTVIAPFTDYANVSNWAKGNLNAAYGLGLVKGNTNGKFEPIDKATRAEAASAIFNLINNL